MDTSHNCISAILFDVYTDVVYPCLTHIMSFQIIIIISVFRIA